MARLAKVASLLVGIFLELCAGIVYSVGVWGDALVAAAGWPETSIRTLKACLDIGLYISIDVGFFVDHFGKRHREGPAAILTSLLLGLGWLCLGWAAWSGQAPIFVGGIAFYLVGHGNFFAFVAPLRANAWNFGPARKGAVDGVLLGGFGISSAVFGQIYHIIFGASHIAEFMIMLAGLCVLIALASSVLTKRIQEDGTTEDPSLDDGGMAVPPFSMLRTLSFWRLWLVLACSGGANVFFVQSAGKLAMGTSMTGATLVTFFSLANLVGRFGGGPIADALQALVARHNHKHKRFYHGRIILAFPSALMMAFAAALPQKEWAVVTSVILAGVSEGLLFACWPGTVRDIYGATHFSANLSLANTGLGIGVTFYLETFGDRLGKTLQAATWLALFAAVLAVSLVFWPGGSSEEDTASAQKAVGETVPDAATHHGAPIAV